MMLVLRYEQVLRLIQFRKYRCKNIGDEFQY